MSHGIIVASLRRTGLIRTLKGQFIDVNGNCVILHISCGGTAGKITACCLVFPQIKADDGGPSSETKLNKLLLRGSTDKEMDNYRSGYLVPKAIKVANRKLWAVIHFYGRLQSSRAESSPPV